MDFEIVLEVDSRLTAKVVGDKINTVRVTIPHRVIDELSRIYKINMHEVILKFVRNRLLYPCRVKLGIDKSRNEPIILIELPRIEIIEFAKQKLKST